METFEKPCAIIAPAEPPTLLSACLVVCHSAATGDLGQRSMQTMLVHMVSMHEEANRDLPHISGDREKDHSRPEDLVFLKPKRHS